MTLVDRIVSFYLTAVRLNGRFKMKIVVLNGTSVKGITYHMKEMFLQYLRTENQITEFYPEDMPPFCV